MTHRKSLLISFIILFPLTFTPAIGAQDHRHVKTSPESYERPGRDTWQKPDEVIAALNVKPTDSVADIGAGSGYFTRRFAPKLSKGIVYAVDIYENMLQYIHRHVEKYKQHNIVTVLCPVNDPMLASDSVDLIFICNTYHHFTNRIDYNKRLGRSLKRGGRVAIVDYHKKALPVGPPPDEKLAREEVVKEMQAAGFRLDKEHSFLPHQYFLVFVRR